MSFISDDNLHMDLRNIPTKSQKQLEDSLPMPDSQIEDSLAISNSLNSDLELDSLISQHISNIESRLKELEDSLAIDDSLLLEDSIVNPISGLTYTSDDDVEIGIGSNIEIEDSLDISHVFSNISTTNTGSSIVTNISDKGISLEGGVDFDKDGNVDAWDIDLGIDYANPDSGTQLLNNSELFDLELENDQTTQKNDDSSFFKDSVLDSVTCLEKNDNKHIETKNESTNIYPQYQEPPLWLVGLIMFTSGFMLITALTVLDIMVCNACPPNKSCHTPIFILILRDLGFLV